MTGGAEEHEVSALVNQPSGFSQSAIPRAAGLAGSGAGLTGSTAGLAASVVALTGEVAGTARLAVGRSGVTAAFVSRGAVLREDASGETGRGAEDWLGGC